MASESESQECYGRRADARRNRERILAAAVRHFAEYGIGTSLEEIAKAAEVGPATLYRHFPSREALLAAALREKQVALSGHAIEAHGIADADAALRAWLDALQDYLRTFNGLPAPVLDAVKEAASPLALSCDLLVSITGDFLARAQREGRARAGLTGRELFLGALAVAFILNRAETCGTSARAIGDLLAYGYLGDAPAGLQGDEAEFMAAKVS